MDAEEIRRLLRTQQGIRVGLRTAEYVARQLQKTGGAFSLMGADARTGVAMSQQIDPKKLMPALPFPTLLFPSLG
jgi:hypothetical protein